MADGRRLLLLAAALLISACAPSTPARRTADDQDLTRDILWEFRKDPRLADVRVTCYDRVLTLEGTVSDRAAQDDALRIIGQKAPGAKIVNSLLLRPR